jgi:hypothetical protein
MDQATSSVGASVISDARQGYRRLSHGASSRSRASGQYCIPRRHCDRVEDEIHTVLSGIDESILGFGPTPATPLGRAGCG